MTDPKDYQTPSMEDILASIRRIIAEEGPAREAPPPPATAPAEPPPAPPPSRLEPLPPPRTARKTEPAPLPARSDPPSTAQPRAEHGLRRGQLRASRGEPAQTRDEPPIGRSRQEPSLGGQRIEPSLGDPRIEREPEAP